jgi:ribosomal-protein-alanine N-acetyltransferase
MTPQEIYARFPLLQSERLVLRDLRPQDAPAVLRIFGDDEVTRYYDLDTFTDLAQAENLIERFQQRYLNQIGIRWGIALNNAEDDLIGTCGYNIWIQGHARAVVGYDLARSKWRQGIMSEALSTVVRFGFAQMGLNRIETPIFAENAASGHLLKKLGFRAEGTLREYEFLKGHFVDLAMYALLQKEWQAFE